MEQIKLFRSKTILPDALETQVNNFLSENEAKISVNDLQYNTVITARENSEAPCHAHK